MLTFKDYFTKEGIKEGRKEGMQEGIKEGMQKSTMNNAKNLKLLGVDIEIIAKATGLSIEEVKKL